MNKILKRILFTIFLGIIIFSQDTCYSISLSSRSAILMERDSGRILYSSNSNQKLPMASTTKIMTALIAIEKGNLNDLVTIEPQSIGIEGSSIYLYEGEKITLKDLIYGLMLRSGNDAAIAIARHISGDTDSFIKLMNDRAKEIGATNTNFTNPHGLHHENHYTTAYDLSLISREALKNEIFREIVSTKLWTSDRDKNEYFYNKNKTLWQYDGGDGVKIGYTTKAGRCLVSSATRNRMQLISVVLDDRNWFNDCYRMFDYGFEHYRPVVILSKNQFIRNIYIDNEQILPIMVKEEVIVPLTQQEKKEITIDVKIHENISCPVYKGDRVGYIKIYMENKFLDKVYIVAGKTVEKKNFIERMIEKIYSISASI
ncbi:D-alanyl-D-alanine carboxypeptidase family protein [Clostridiisalibacter paucivorans]|uniref:D-alanyl-D-alanine carboxypeptidase family protein n=1 Tax=Clostridiisalibacter paucivorans TaxID=408753 RepID=UPI00047A2774|nr:D-alanyl-D-alanine carboxypeptidase family protein [Clostridiisalibacter paucivorans]